MKRSRAHFTEHDDVYLKTFYASAPRDDICRRLDRTWRSVCSHARLIGLSRPNIRTHQLAVLLPDTLQNAYWWGFIMADGYISPRGVLRIHLSELDEGHLAKLACYIGKGGVTALPREMVSLEAGDKINGMALRSKLNIRKAKTTNPPSLDFLQTPEHRLAFFLGFVDGDGSLHFDHNGTFKTLSIEIHGSWYERLRDFSDDLADNHPFKFTVTKTKRGYTHLYLGTKASHRYLIDFATDNALPILDRKWYPKSEKAKAH